MAADQLREIFRVGAGLEPERAADIVGENAQPVLRQLHDGDDRLAHGGGALRADAQRVKVGGGVVARGRAARLHRRDRHALIHHRDPRDEFCAGEDFVDLPRIGLRIGRRPRPVDCEVSGASGHT